MYYSTPVQEHTYLIKTYLPLPADIASTTMPQPATAIKVTYAWVHMLRRTHYRAFADQRKSKLPLGQEECSLLADIDLLF